MIRSRWISGLAGVLAILGPALAEPFFTPDQIINVQEGKAPARKCKVLRTWYDRDGAQVCLAQALDNGEKMTILAPKGLTRSSGSTVMQRMLAKEGATPPPPQAPALPPKAIAPPPPPVVKAPPAKAPAPIPAAATEKATAKAVPPPDTGTVERWSSAEVQKALDNSESRVEALPRPVPPPVARKGVPEPIATPEKFTKVPDPSSATSPEVQVVAKKDVPPAPTPLAPPMASLPGDAPAKGSMLPRLSALLPRPSIPAPAKPLAPAPAAPPSPVGLASVQAAHALMLEELAGTGKGKAKQERPEGAFAMPPVVSLPGGPTWTDSGVPAGMGNAFTNAVTSRPVPADFGIGFGGPGAFTPRPAGVLPPPPPPPTEILKGLPPEVQTAMNLQYQAMLAQYNAAMRGQAPASPAAPEAARPVVEAQMASRAPAQPSPAQGLITALQKSDLPSEREMAADQLRRVDWRSEAAVVPALLQAARKDPAPAVRLTCVRALAHMKANTPEAIQALEELKDSGDARLGAEAAEALRTVRAARK
jgi:hypothetical protein